MRSSSIVLVLAAGLTACELVGSERATRETVDGRLVVTTHSLPTLASELPFAVEWEARSDSARGVFLTSLRTAVSLSTAGIALIDRRTRQVVEYGPNGDVIRVRGGQGDGPGEFRNPGTVTVLGRDSLLVYDSQLRRLTTLPSDGSQPSIEPLDMEAFELAPLDLWRLPGGRLLSFEGHRSAALPRVTTPDANLVAAGALVRVISDDDRPDTLFAEGVASEMVQIGTMLMTAPFGRETLVSANGSSVAVVWSDSAVVDRFNGSTHVYRARFPGLDVELTPSDVERIRDSIRIETVRTGLPFVAEVTYMPDLQPARSPAFARVVVGASGRVYLRQFAPLGRRSPLWWVVSVDGVMQARFRLPPDADLLAEEHDRVLLARRDALDVPWVQVASVDWASFLESSQDLVH